MSNHDFLSYYNDFSPSPALTSPDQHTHQHHQHYFHQDLASPMDTPATTTSTANGVSAYSSTAAVVEDAWARYNAGKRAEEEKNALLEEMIHRYNYVSQEYAKLLDQVTLEKSRHPHSNGTTGTPLTSNSLYKEDYEKLKRQVDREPFVLVLIDGDGMVFHEHFLSKGEEGGRQAALVLRQSADLYAHEQILDLPRDVRVVTRMYANVRGLADACARAGLVETPKLVEEFVRGFTRGDTLFDFVDVGPGKDRADEKVSEMFKLHAYDVRCKHIVFGCSHDNGFARLLEKYIFDTTITSRVTLLEGLPFGKQLLDLPFHRSKFGTIFRSEKLVLPTIAPPTGTARPTTNGTSIERAAAAAASAAVLMRSMTHTPSDSVSSADLADSTFSKPTTGTGWASVAARAARRPPTPPAEKPTPSPAPAGPATIPRNKAGQRLDLLMKHDKSEVERVRKLKMCNVHYLRNECPYGAKCTHKHDRNPTARDLEVLKVVARYACCRQGPECDDPKCIYGHRCQAPERKDPTKWPTERGKTCIFGPECAFPAELHNIDVVPYKGPRKAKDDADPYLGANFATLGLANA